MSWLQTHFILKCVFTLKCVPGARRSGRGPLQNAMTLRAEMSLATASGRLAAYFSGPQLAVMKSEASNADNPPSWRARARERKETRR